MKGTPVNRSEIAALISREVVNRMLTIKEIMNMEII
jgi:hypothetical protein